MDSAAQPDRADDQPYSVRLSDPGDIAAGIPHLLGFRPTNSVVVISLTGPSGRRVGLTMRADIPAPRHDRAFAHQLASGVRSDDPDAVVLAVVSEAANEDGDRDLPHRQLVQELTMAMTSAGLPVRDVLLVRSGRWWSYDCPHRCCDPTAGTPLPSGVTELEVATVASGVVVARDRDEVAARLERSPEAAAIGDAVLRTASERVVDILDRGRDPVRAEAIAAIAAAAAAGPTAGMPGPRLADDDLARMVWALRDDVVRDAALAFALGPDAEGAEALWMECARRAPAPLDAAPATLLAVSAWLRGDGATANIALERALGSDPDYALAHLLSQALASCLSPKGLRRLIRASSPASATRGRR
jgi:hypothetical protein